MLEKKFDLQNFKQSQNKVTEYLKEKNIQIPHSVILNALSVFMGYKDWHTLKPLLNKNSNELLSPAPSEYGLKVYIYRRKDLDNEVICSLMNKHFANYGKNGLFTDNFMFGNISLENHYLNENLKNIDRLSLKNIGVVDPDLHILKEKWHVLNKQYNVILFISYQNLIQLREKLSEHDFSLIKEISFLNTDESNLPPF